MWLLVIITPFSYLDLMDRVYCAGVSGKRYYEMADVCALFIGLFLNINFINHMTLTDTYSGLEMEGEAKGLCFLLFPIVFNYFLFYI